MLSAVQNLLNNLPLFFQSSVQDWGEEVEDGAIYNVTLKRVQIQQAANKGARWLGVSWHLEFVENTLKSKTLIWKGLNVFLKAHSGPYPCCWLSFFYHRRC